MKRLIKIATGLFLTAMIALIASCRTTGPVEPEENEFGDSTTIENGFVLRSTTPDKATLGRYEMMSVTGVVENPQYFTFSNWSKIRIFNDFLDTLDFHEDLTNWQKYKLMSYIFDDLPMNGKEGIAREVYVGRFFDTGVGAARNLVIRVGVISKNANSFGPNNKLIVLATNAVKENNSVSRTTGAFHGNDVNATVISVNNNSLLTNVNNVNAINNNRIDVSKLSGFNIILFARQLLSDEELGNDLVAHDIIMPLITDEKRMPAVRVSAMLVEFEYRISKGDVYGAQTLWNEIVEYSEKVPTNMLSANFKVKNGASLYLLRKLRASGKY